MTVHVLFADPGMVTRRTHDSVTRLNGIEAFGYDRFTKELEATGGIRVSFTGREEIPSTPAILCTRDDFELEERPASSLARTVLMDAPLNAALKVATLGLLGSVLESEFRNWHLGKPVRLDRSIMARRAVAEAMGAVGDRVYTLDEYCYLGRDDWTSLPQVLGDYLRAV